MCDWRIMDNVSQKRRRRILTYFVLFFQRCSIQIKVCCIERNQLFWNLNEGRLTWHHPNRVNELRFLKRQSQLQRKKLVIPHKLFIQNVLSVIERNSFNSGTYHIWRTSPSYNYHNIYIFCTVLKEIIFFSTF